jgi:plasmid stabilization system protein ParE
VVRRVVVRSEARAEIFEARRWYEDRASGLGRTFGEVLDSVIVRIATDPAQFPRVHGDTRRAVLTRFPYAVYFRETSDQVVILAVHGRQDPNR